MPDFSIEWDGLTELGDVLAKAMRESESKVKTVIYNNGEKAKAKAIEWAPKPGGSRYGDNPYAKDRCMKILCTRIMDWLRKFKR